MQRNDFRIAIVGAGGILLGLVCGWVYNLSLIHI